MNFQRRTIARLCTTEQVSLVAVTLACLLVSRFAPAAWSTDPIVNNVVCAASGNQSYPQVVSDGAGGAIIAWQDLRNGIDYDIYAQRIDKSGTPLWTPGGIAICIATGDQDFPQLMSDGLGGAFVIWSDNRSGVDSDIYAQRIDASGTAQWIANGVTVCTASGNQFPTQTVTDGSGGMIILWADRRAGYGVEEVYGQRLDGYGMPQWAKDGVAICPGTAYQIPSDAISDGNGGAIVVWSDYPVAGPIIGFAQRINGDGVAQWSPDGIVVAQALDVNDYRPRAVTDDAGGGR